MTMRRITLISVAVAACLVVAAGFLRPPPTLRILINGKPAAGVSVIDFQTGTSTTTDADGKVSYKIDPRKQNAIFFPDQDVAHLLSFPDAGLKTVDFRGRYTITTSNEFVWGIFPSKVVTESFNVNNDEIEAVRRGERTTEEVAESIRREAELQR